MEFIVRCFHKDGEDNVIGAEVVVYDGAGDAKKIVLTDETLLNELIAKLDVIDTTYIKVEDLLNYLKNEDLSTEINAKFLNSMPSDSFLKTTDTTRYTFKPAKHDSNNGNLYGMGTAGNYGHVKVIDDTNHDRFTIGEALAAHQGYELNRRIKTLEDNNKDITQDASFHSHFNLAKRNGIVTLTIDDWDVSRFMGGALDVWREVYTVPDAFKPALPIASNVKYIYFDNIFDSGNKVRMRLHYNSGKISVRMDAEPGHTFYSHVTWIAKE